ncbi:MAG: glyoxylate/hydroxypyruvate reductase A [Balneola sp.]|jgi:glyoxylate/hydroxypyruvate reductase A
MSLLLIAPNRDLKPLSEALENIDHNLEVDIWPKVKNKDRVTFAVAWNHPKNVLGNYPNLKAVSSLGAGVNHLLNDESLPENVKLARLITPSLKNEMAEYVLQAVLAYRHHTTRYADQKREAFWDKHKLIPKEDSVVGILGFGEMGSSVADLLILNGYKVNTWSRSKKDYEGITSYNKDELNEFLNNTNILICTLPLTVETQGILDLELFKKLKKPAYLINAGRGQHLIEEDLIYAIDTGVLAGAWLDVFEEEPLPSNHLFWNRPKIMITPHIAAVTDSNEAAEQIIENYKRSLSGMEMVNSVDRKKGY